MLGLLLCLDTAIGCSGNIRKNAQGKRMQEVQKNKLKVLYVLVALIQRN